MPKSKNRKRYSKPAEPQQKIALIHATGFSDSIERDRQLQFALQACITLGLQRIQIVY